MDKSHKHYAKLKKQIQKAAHCVVPCIRHSRKGKIIGGGWDQTHCSQGSGGGGKV